jgi:hypothetical protein
VATVLVSGLDSLVQVEPGAVLVQVEPGVALARVEPGVAPVRVETGVAPVRVEPGVAPVQVEPGVALVQGELEVAPCLTVVGVTVPVVPDQGISGPVDTCDPVALGYHTPVLVVTG